MSLERRVRGLELRVHCLQSIVVKSGIISGARFAVFRDSRCLLLKPDGDETLRCGEFVDASQWIDYFTRESADRILPEWTNEYQYAFDAAYKRVTGK